jgi:antitoxin component of MazEF toxin-antitoxin module
MKLQLEQVGEDTVLILPPDLIARLGLSEGDELVATVRDQGIDLHRLSPPDLKDEDSTA